MADDDNFDIDIYGDESPEYVEETTEQEADDIQYDEATNQGGREQTNQSFTATEPKTEPQVQPQDDINITGMEDPGGEPKQAEVSGAQQEVQQQIASSTGLTGPQLSVPKQAPRQQGVKQQEGVEDSRQTDAGATAALRLGELQWWLTEDDVRGWANQCEVENELKEVTFNEHKVNGKSKGEVFIELQTPQAATALKRHIDGFGAGQQYVKKHTVIYVRPDYNPFKTYPKDAPARGKETFKDRQPGAYNTGFNNSGGGGGGGFRGGRGGYNNNRGGMNNTGNSGMGGFNQGRGGYSNQTNFGAMSAYGGMNNGMNTMGGMGMNNMGGFGAQMGYSNRGGGNAMGMNRGGFNSGRGGRGNAMGNMGMMPNMGMGGMGAMNMGGMGTMGVMGAMGGMGMGFPQGQYNPQFFGGANAGQSMSPGGNPHGAKRPRPE